MRRGCVKMTHPHCVKSFGYSQATVFCHFQKSIFRLKPKKIKLLFYNNILTVLRDIYGTRVWRGRLNYYIPEHNIFGMVEPESLGWKNTPHCGFRIVFHLFIFRRRGYRLTSCMTDPYIMNLNICHRVSGESCY